MLSITARNVSEALRVGMCHLRSRHREIAPRNGEVTWEYPTPVTTTYLNPTERVLNIDGRGENPFFHLMEALWILSGRNDVEWLAYFNEGMRNYSDDGQVFHGAYGFRLRTKQGCDQIERVIDLLRSQPETRRAVLQIWDAYYDLGANSKDIPCNDLIFFKIRDEELHMTVCCRSNDVIWGAYGANAVQFSMLQEYIATKVGVGVGTYTQMSDSFHAYVDNPVFDKMRQLDIYGYCPYTDGDVKPYPIMHVPDVWDRDLDYFMSGVNGYEYINPFFYEVAHPMRDAWIRHKECGDGLAVVQHIKATDWRMAATRWLESKE